jgi:hypothetical protein
MAQCCLYYCQEQNKNRGHLLELIPGDLRGTKELKKQSTEVFGKIRTLYKKDENKHFVPTLVWLFNKWAQQHADSIGRSVMRCQKIGWKMVKDKAIPHRTTSRKVKGKVVYQTQYTVPKNIGRSPLCSPQEKTLLKALAHIGYHNPLKDKEETWKAMSAQDQHASYDSWVDTLREVHNAYMDTAARICGRQYKRRRYFEAVTNSTLGTGKKKKADPKVVSKHLADMSKEVFSNPDLAAKIPLATSCWVLLVNTTLEDIVTNIANNSLGLDAYFDSNRQKQVKSAANVTILSGNYLEANHGEAYLNFISTNQYSALDDSDEEEEEDMGDNAT